MKDFFVALEKHVCQQIGDRKLNKRNKNLKFKSKSILRKITPTDKAGAVKVSQHNTVNLSSMKFSRKITPNRISVMVR